MRPITRRSFATRSIVRLSRYCLIASFGLVLACAAEWQIEAISDIPGGKFSSMKLDSAGNAHVVHQDGVEGMFHYSFWDHTLNRWFSTDLGRSSGFCSLTLDSKQHPHISYPSGTGVTHTYWDGEKWQNQFADIHARVINYYTSIVLDPKDYPSISFYEEAGAGDAWGRLRVVSWNGKYWDVKTVDPDHGSGKFNSMATNSKGYPEIAYGNVEYGNRNLSLRYAYWNGQAWKAQILESTGTSMWSVSMVLDSKDVPHITYTDVSSRLVKYATRQAGQWVFQPVASIVEQSYPDRNSIAVDSHGNPYIGFYDGGAGAFKVSHREDGKWITETLDTGYAGYTSSMQIANDTIFITYGDERGELLRFARRSIAPPAPPAKQTLESKKN